MNDGGVEDYRENWFRNECGKDLLKVLSGIRGAGKTHVLGKFIRELRERGVAESNIVHLDFEAPEMRHVKTHQDVLKIIAKRKAVGKVYLFLDEITALLDFEVLMGVLFGNKDLDLTVATSNRRLFTSAAGRRFEGCMSELHLPAPRERARSRLEMERVWGTMFLRDVLGGHSLADATAEERLAEFFSDRLGELLSLRRISQSLVINEHKLHPNTIGAYTEALVDAYLLESVPIYDVFERYVMNVGCRYFWVDPELRANRFGSAPDFEPERAAYNEAYLRLRRTRGRVMCARSSETFANFVVFDSRGEPEEIAWKES